MTQKRLILFHLKPLLLLALAAITGLVVGCDVPIAEFPPNAVYVARMEKSSGGELQGAAADTADALEILFGTPDQPRWPEFLQSELQSGDGQSERASAQLVDLERLEQAAGAVRSDENDVHFGLYREHCLSCHGISGNGVGPTSRLLSPYPRDFRLGKFKFKSTPIGSKPTRGDLRKILDHGIPGTSMPSFRLLKDEELEALVDYVIYLSVRGESERALISDAALELDYEAGERLFEKELHGTESAESSEFQQQWSRIEQRVGKIASSWEAAESAVTEVPEPAADFPLYGRDNNGTPEQREQLAASVARGDRIFRGSVANCVSCHGPNAEGDGPAKNFDAWTKDWTDGLDPLDRSQIRPFLKLGALKPTHIAPRNLRTGVYRGGGTPRDLSLRIVNGIDGTPMPAAAVQPDNPQGLTESEVWDLVNYLLSLPDSPSPVVREATNAAV